MAMTHRQRTYPPSSLEENAAFLEEYIDSIAIPYDDFLEGHILNADIYSIFIDEKQIGFFGTLTSMVTLFYIQQDYFSLANGVFSDIKTRFKITTAFIPTTDTGFLSVALECYQKIEIQALHFTMTNAVVPPAQFPREQFRLARIDECAAIAQFAGDFLDDYEGRIRRQHIYVLEEKGELLGLGVLVENKIMRNCIGTGMFTREDRRGEGIGRSIILHLKVIAQEMGKTPVPGCWYYNTGSKKTLESAGYISKSKLLKFHF